MDNPGQGTVLVSNPSMMSTLARDLFREVRPGLFRVLAERNAATYADSHDAFFHVDAAQGFGKRIAELQNPRLDLISISGHKVFAPKGIGALVTRRRGYQRPPLTPLCYGGGQERGLRPGTLPVALVVALGTAAELCGKHQTKRTARCQQLKKQALEAFRKVGGVPTGDQDKALPSTLNISVPGLDSEAVMVALKETIAISVILLRRNNSLKGEGRLQRYAFAKLDGWQLLAARAGMDARAPIG